MIDTHWKRIAGFYILENGDSAAAWLALDPLTDTITAYDCALFRNELPVVVAEGLNARGRWVPVAWEKKSKDYADKLLERGCNMTHEPADDSDLNAEAASRDILERMRTGRFKIDKRLKVLIDEVRSLHHEGSAIPRDSAPLVAATRLAVSRLDYARRQAPKHTKPGNFPKLAII